MLAVICCCRSIAMIYRLGFRARYVCVLPTLLWCCVYAPRERENKKKTINKPRKKKIYTHFSHKTCSNPTQRQCQYNTLYRILDRRCVVSSFPPNISRSLFLCDVCECVSDSIRFAYILNIYSVTRAQRAWQFSWHSMYIHRTNDNEWTNDKESERRTHTHTHQHIYTEAQMRYRNKNARRDPNVNTIFHLPTEFIFFACTVCVVYLPFGCSFSFPPTVRIKAPIYRLLRYSCSNQKFS